MIERYLTDKVNIVFLFFSTFHVKIHFVVETKARKLKVELSLSAKIRNLNLEDNQRATFLCVRGFQKIPSSFFHFYCFFSFCPFLSISFLIFSLLIFSFLLYWGENWIGENISKVHPHIVWVHFLKCLLFHLLQFESAYQLYAQSFILICFVKVP